MALVEVVVEAEEQPCQKGPEVLVNSKLDMSQPQPLATKIARSILVCVSTVQPGHQGK